MFWTSAKVVKFCAKTALLQEEKTTGTLWSDGWVDSRASEDSVEKRGMSALPVNQITVTQDLKFKYDLRHEH
jgi:hypothetical protein